MAAPFLALQQQRPKLVPPARTATLCLLRAVGFLVLSAVVLVSIAVPFILPVFVPLAVAFVWLRNRYLGASREIKRWEATSR